MKKNYHTREQVAMRLELEAYRGNQALEKIYIELLNTSQVDIDRLIIINDLKRVRSNMQYLKEQLVKLPKLKRDFLYDVYFNQDIDTPKIMEKYGLKRSTYHRYLDRVIYEIAKIE